MAAQDDTSTHEKRAISATAIEALADKLFVSGLECRRADLLIAAALLRRLSLDGDVEEFHVWKLREETRDADLPEFSRASHSS